MSMKKIYEIIMKFVEYHVENRFPVKMICDCTYMWKFSIATVWHRPCLYFIEFIDWENGVFNIAYSYVGANSEKNLLFWMIVLSCWSTICMFFLWLNLHSRLCWREITQLLPFCKLHLEIRDNLVTILKMHFTILKFLNTALWLIFLSSSITSPLAYLWEHKRPVEKLYCGWLYLMQISRGADMIYILWSALIYEMPYYSKHA